ncbi:MAG: hypothetical protein B6I22_02610 [Desulfobacteraceae bacterium 4572_123]|nr:MAG: hypothetical protein B6I22_02610 [Desulfobacteraceae bacterium 4572_123]
MVATSYGCAAFKLPAFSDNTGSISGYESDSHNGKYLNSLTTGIDCFITKNYVINLRLILYGQDNEIDCREIPLRFDSEKIGPMIDCKYYF